MNGIDFLADTNIIIYALEGNPAVADVLKFTPALSVISEIELFGKMGISKSEVAGLKKLLSGFSIFDINEEIKTNAILLKQSYNIKTPDAIIAATAQTWQLPLITADKGFAKLENIIDLVIVNHV